MDEQFLLVIDFKDEVLKYDVELRSFGYIQRVAVDGILVQYELDEEGNYRALVTPKLLNSKDNNLEVGLLQAIAHRLEALQSL